MKEKDFKKLLILYIERVSGSIELVNELKNKYPWYVNEAGFEVTDLPISGYLGNGGVHFKFHGTGCKLTYADDTIVDFDFDIAAREGEPNKGFDIWFFVRFVKSLKKDEYREYEDEKRVKQLLSEMVESGELYPPGSLSSYGYNNRVYYFKEDFEYLKAERPWED